MSIYDWLCEHDRGDEIMFRLAGREKMDDLIIEYSVLAANHGFTKRQLKALNRIIVVLNAYVRVTMEKNKDIKSPIELLTQVNIWRGYSKKKCINLVVNIANRLEQKYEYQRNQIFMAQDQ